MARVLIIGPTPPPYQGMAIFTEMLLRSPVLARAFEVLHLDTADRRGLDNMGRFELRNVVLALRHAVQLAVIVIRRRPDVVYVEVSQNEWAYLRDAVFMAIARAFGCRVVTHLHGSQFRSFYETARAPFRALVRHSSRWLDAALVLGEGLRGLYRGLVPEARVLVAPNGIEDPFPEGPPERGRATWHAQGGAAPGEGAAAEGAFAEGATGAGASGADTRPLNVAYLGAMFRPKGFVELLRAAALLRDLGPPLRFVFAGPWVSVEEREEAESLVAREGLERMVRFSGVVTGEEKRAFFREADLLVFPGYQPEGLPLVILEAMAAGLPVVSTSAGAIPDAVVDGETGLLVSSRDPEALARAILELARDAALRERLGRAGRARFLAEFTDRRCAERLIAVLNAVREGGLEDRR